jgi:hypothetical protein
MAPAIYLSKGEPGTSLAQPLIIEVFKLIGPPILGTNGSKMKPKQNNSFIDKTKRFQTLKPAFTGMSQPHPGQNESQLF